MPTLDWMMTDSRSADVKVTAKMLRTGTAADTTATLFIDDMEAGRRSI